MVGFFSVNRDFWTVFSLKKILAHNDSARFQEAISELPFASFLKWGLVLNHAYENEFSLHVNENF